MNYIKDLKIKQIIKRALAEDIGKDDITTRLLFPKKTKIQAVILAGEAGVICGINIARLIFELLDNNTRFIPRVKDGNQVKKGQILARIYGKASSILSGERVALNFVGLLSGIATRTRQFVNKIKDYRVKIMDTRKTLPGLRELEKYAVKVGGGYNHRFRLDEMVLIKDNHLQVIAYAGSPKVLYRRTHRLNAAGLEDSIRKIKKRIPSGMKIEIEAKNLKEFRLALKVNPDIIMLDNMRVGQIKSAVRARDRLKPKPKNSKPQIEASGNINLENIRSYARTGINFISLGTLTKDIHSLDLSLETK